MEVLCLAYLTTQYLSSKLPCAVTVAAHLDLS